jgi:hypothetical protein
MKQFTGRKMCSFVISIFIFLVVVSCTNNSNETSLLRFTNFQDATLVIGQPDFNTGTLSSASDKTLNILYGNPWVHNDVLYLPDRNNNRVLGFNSFPTSIFPSANFVLGQPDFTTSNSGTNPNQMHSPQTTQVYDGKLFLVEYSNSRVIIWNTIPTTTQTPADLVIGWPNFDTPTYGVGQNMLYQPNSICVAVGKLFVADSDNHRVLIWNSIPSTNGQPADIVIGQSDFSHNTENDDDQNGTSDGSPTARTFDYPYDVWSDGEKLIVVDCSNHRVLVWKSIPVQIFTPADVVIGQSDFVSKVLATTRTGLNYPFFTTSNGTQLFVCDWENHRVLIWDSIPDSNNAPADVVLGQSDFEHGAPNDDDQDGNPDPGPSARTLYEPLGLQVYNDKLIVADHQNHRYLVFQSQ